MNFIITKPFGLLTVLREFNPDLVGKHIRIKGVTWKVRFWFKMSIFGELTLWT